MVIVSVFLAIDNKKLKKERIKEIETEKRESKKREDSIIKSRDRKEKAYLMVIEQYKKNEDSINKLYEKSLEDVERARVGIRNYLNASDSERFAKFRDLLTEVD